MNIITILAALLFLATSIFWLICRLGTKSEKEQEKIFKKSFKK